MIGLSGSVDDVGESHGRIFASGEQEIRRVSVPINARDWVFVVGNDEEWYKGLIHLPIEEE